MSRAAKYFASRGIAVPTFDQIDYYVRNNNEVLTNIEKAMLETIGTQRSFAMIVERVQQSCEAPITAPTRKRRVVECRQLAQALGHKWLGIPTEQVGMVLGGRDHATVIHSCRTVRNLFERDKAYRSWAMGIVAPLGANEEDMREILSRRLREY